MAKAKNKYLYPPKSRLRTNYNQHNYAKTVILTVIFLATLVVVATTIASFFLTKESRIKRQITHLATDYYENYFYTNLTSSPDYKALTNPTSVMENFHTYGLARKTLNDLLLYDNQKNANYADFLSEYCDVNKTYVRIFPDPPYEKNSYHIEYNYACDF